ncbi:MAG: aminotransferase class I/II-fold pyridoxal phosphate-dependent enzyme [Rhizomicrobium sp.]
MKQSSLVLHAGFEDKASGAPVMNPLELATSFYVRPDEVGFSANSLNGTVPLVYSRWRNPTVDLLEQRMAALEGGEAALALASGMAAVAGLFFYKLKAGDHLVLSNVCYAGVAELAQEILPRYGIAVTPVDTSDPARVAAALRPETKLIHVETPANPILRLTDIEAVAALAHSHGAALSVDSTMATPVATRPIALGADYVVHSLTKYACGHGDALGGVVVGRQQDVADLHKMAAIHFGGVISPFSAWLILRGLETLPARMALHEANAAKVTAFLQNHPRVKKAWWPGSESHPQYALARKQMRNFSGMVSFSADDGEALAGRIAERITLFSYAVSLGKTRSLIFYIPTDDLLRTSFHLEGDEAEAYRAWTGEGTFRLSVGLEDADELIADLDQALS